MNQHRADVLITEPDIVLLDASHEVVQLGNNFDARESAATDDEGKQFAAQAGILLDIRLFKHMNNVIAQRHGVG